MLVFRNMRIVSRPLFSGWLLVCFASCVTTTASQEGVSRSRGDSRAKYVPVLTSRYSSLGNIAVAGNSEVRSVDELVLMLRFPSHTLNAPGHELPAETARQLSEAFPGYSLRRDLVAIVDDGEEDHQREIASVTKEIRSGLPMAYGRIHGQHTGMAGILFVESGLGDPRPEFTPVGVVFQGWSDLLAVLKHATEDRKKLPIRILTGDQCMVGEYSIVGFQAEEVPQQITELLAPCGE